MTLPESKIESPIALLIGQTTAAETQAVRQAVQRASLCLQAAAHLPAPPGIDTRYRPQPAVVLISPVLPSRLTLARRARQAYPNARILLLASGEQESRLRRAVARRSRVATDFEVVRLDSCELNRVLNNAAAVDRRNQRAKSYPQRDDGRSTARPDTARSDYRRLVISDRYLASILTHALDAIISIDDAGTILTWNEAAERLCGYRADQIVGTPLASIAGGSSGGQEVQRLIESLAAGEPDIRRELLFFHADGSAVEVEASMAPVRDELGRQIGISIIARDISERKRAEEALRASEKLAATGRLAATIAHEINNPLESVTNLLYLLERHPGLEDTAREYATLAQRELGRVAHIARQMLGFYRDATRPIPVRLRQVIENVIDLYGHKARNAGVQIAARLEDDEEIWVFPGEIRQVFSNLIINAMEAAGNGGRVLVHLYKSPALDHSARRGVWVSVADTGAGIPAGNLNRIFEPFFTTKGEHGTGLGLWVTRGIVQKHEGHIRVRSSTRPGRSGTVFSVFFPLHSQLAMSHSSPAPDPYWKNLRAG